MKNKEYEMDMCSGGIFGKLVALTIPLMLSGMLQLLFNAVDIVVVGNFGSENSVAAVGNTTALINLMTNLFLGMSVGANVLVSRYVGAREGKKANDVIHTSLMLGIICGVFLSAVGLLFGEPILKIMQTPDDVIKLSALYIKIYFMGMPAMMVYNFGSSILRSKGDTKRPLYYLTFAGIANALLNLFFCIVLKMDVAGVALASVISQFMSALLILRCLSKENETFKFEFKKLKITPHTAASVLRIGIPAGLQGVVFSLSNVVIQSSINEFGSVVMAGNAAAASIEGFVWTAMNAFSQTALTFVGQNIGRGKYSRINRIAFTALLCSTVTGLVLGNLACLFGPQLLSIYDPRPEIIEPGMTRMRIVCGFYFFCGLMDCMVGSIRGMGYAVTPTVVSLLGACGLRILWIFTVFRIPEYHTQKMLFYSYPMSWAITFTVHLICFIIMRKRLPKEDAANS